VPVPQPLCARHDGPRSLTTWRLAFVLILLTSGYLSIAVSQIALGIALALTLAGWIVCRQAPPRTGIEWPVLLLAGWALLMIPFSTDPGQSAVYYKRFFLFTAIWVTAGAAVTERRRWLMLGFLLLGAGAVSIIGIANALEKSGGLFHHRMREISNPMTSGAMMMMVVLVALGFLLARGVGRRRRIAVGAVFLLLMLAFVMTMTRSAFLGFFAGVGLMLLMTRPRTFGVFFAAVLLLGVIVATTGEGWLSERMWKRLNPEVILQGENTTTRVEMWKGGLAMVKARPVTGVGDRGLENISREYYTPDSGLYFGHMHNNFVHLAVIWGVPGLLLGTFFLFAPLWVLIRRWIRMTRETDPDRAPPALRGWVLGAAGAWAAFIVAGFTEWYVGDAETMLIALAMLGAALGPRTTDPAED
jgi:O-antigen ligase